jgi:predicted HAD superfamily Cof-like phosphohydrolase
MIEQVKEFMTACEQLPTEQGFVDLINLRFRLIDEEVKELHDAETPVEHLDAIVDILYVAYGALLAFGVEDEFSEDSHESIPYNFKVLKQDKLLMSTDNLVVARSYEEFIDAIHDIIFVAHKLGAMFPLEEAFDEVHQSNMSKLVDGKPVKNHYGKVLKGPYYAPPNLGLYIPEENDVETIENN